MGGISICVKTYFRSLNLGRLKVLSLIRTGYMNLFFCLYVDKLTI